MRLIASVVALLAAGTGFHVSARSLPPRVSAEVVHAGFWHSGCPVPLSGVRLLTVTHWGFDGRTHTGQLVVSRDAVVPLSSVFRRLYALHFPLRHMLLDDIYGGPKAPKDNDVSASFECRQAAASPCTGKGRTGSWSMHAYGLAIDLNPVENPYVGCGMTRDKTALSYLDRSRVRKGMVTPAVVEAFRAVGWAGAA